MSLRELQRRFQHHLLAGDEAIVADIRESPPLPVADRLHIYGHGYRVRLIDALHDTYPSLHRILGDEMFMAVGEAFVEAHPSVHRSIRWYGSELAPFLARNPPYSDQPILTERARFEWTLSEVFDAADAQPLNRAALSTIDPAAWPDLCFEFHPSLRRLSLAWNTVAAWKAVSREDEPPAPECADEPVPWLLWRQSFKNYFRSMDASENAALEAALAAHSFGDICAALAPFLPEEEIPLRAAGLIGTWTDSGIIVATTPH
jgi:hypothetical protein